MIPQTQIADALENAAHTANEVAVVRHDKAPVRVGATPVEVRDNGARVYEGTAAFGDIVKRYPDLDPPRNEFIPADEAMSPAALASLRGAVFTGGRRRVDWDGTVTLPADHPDDLTTPDTAGDLLEGVVLDAWRHDPPGGGFPELKVRVIAHTRPMQALIESGTRELSLGMRAREDWTPGVGPRCGTPYQCVQRRIVYDHLNVVGAARSRTPDGRPARLDGEPRSYPHPEHPAMADEALTPDKPDDSATTSKPIDVLTARLDALSPEGLALMKQMSPEDQALVVAAMPADAAVVDPAAAAASAEGAAAEMDMAAMVAMLQDHEARLAALETGDAGAVEDAAPMTDPAKPADKKDSAAMADKNNPAAPARPTFDAAAIIAKATREAQAAASAQFNADAELVAIVRKDGHADVHTTTEAAARMLGVVKAHCPVLAPLAEAELKVGRMDTLKVFYQQADAIRRDGISRANEQHVLGDVLGAPLPADAGPVKFRTPGSATA